MKQNEEMDFVARMAYTLERIEKRPQPIPKATRGSMVKELAGIFGPVCLVYLVVGAFCRDDAQATLALIGAMVCQLLKDNL